MDNANGANEFKSIQNAAPDREGIIELPVIPLYGSVVYPDVIMPLMLSDERALAAARAVNNAGGTALTVAVRPESSDGTDYASFYSIGTETALGRMIRMPEGNFSVLAEGRRRVEIVEYLQVEPYIVARARVLSEPKEDTEQLTALEHTLVTMFEDVVDLNENLPDDVLDYALGGDDPGWLADFIATTLSLSIEEHQTVLEHVALEPRLRYLATLLGREVNMLEIKGEINDRIHEEMARNQREVYLREQMRVIQGELGEEDVYQQDMDDIRQQIENSDMPEYVAEKARKELSRLQQVPPMTPEVGVIRTYLDWLVSLPWSKRSDDNLDLQRAQDVLEAEHYGLKRVKDRVLEHIAVRKLAADKMKTPILCFVGPPGVGKTSMGRSIANALGREFVRVSLGGVRDEAEIRGHRRTYIGALPGRIIQTMASAGTINPVFMLDEIDKLGADFRGDPSAALLEALDPEQNGAYSDHYLDVSYDLSQVLFITTANDLGPIESALLDRMEVIEFPGYTEEDKLAIARRFLIPNQLEAHGLTDSGLRFATEALMTIVREYTYEAGVRNMNREIGTVCRKVARRVAQDKGHPRRITARQVRDYLGPPQYIELRANDQDAVGLATGLAWTPSGGDILAIEVSVLAGKGNLTLTGQLGDIMQESAQAALSFMRAVAPQFDVPSDDFENYDIHVHLPEGAVPKDGPSAGITLAVAIISAFTEAKVRADYAMTGEVTLRGRVLPVGGIKEKVLAAHRNRIFNVILPSLNRKDLEDVPPKALKDMNILFVDHMQAVIDTVLLPPPAQRERDRLAAEREAEAESAGMAETDDEI